MEDHLLRWGTFHCDGLWAIFRLMILRDFYTDLHILRIVTTHEQGVRLSTSTKRRQRVLYTAHMGSCICIYFFNYIYIYIYIYTYQTCIIMYTRCWHVGISMGNILRDTKSNGIVMVRLPMSMGSLWDDYGTMGYYKHHRICIPSCNVYIYI